ncbi:phage tail assembly chaperone [Marinicrinis lubricantis]|uniref:Phage XkdN-like tail assembly chaperone protein, TAC n=1 Tax=Marinicrinis lubricantis TaxID=2086470 RepID=A0ABW1IIW2_9BACL
MGKKLSITDLLAQKEQLRKKRKRTMSLHVDSLDAEIVIEEPSRVFALEALEMAQDPMRRDKADAHVVYHCVVEPNLKDRDLQKQFGCAEPTDIVDMIFRAGEVSSISGYILQLAGFDSVKKVDADLKNE